MAGKDSTQDGDRPPPRGRVAEDLAAQWLTARGLRIIARNVRYRGGEIDLVCRDSASLVFVEVRLRSNAKFGGAAESITPTKQRRLIAAARLYLAQHPHWAFHPARFDCLLLESLDESRIRWIRDAFRCD